MEDLKGRYYSIARQLLTGREGGPETVSNQASPLLFIFVSSYTSPRDRLGALWMGPPLFAPQGVGHRQGWATDKSCSGSCCALHCPFKSRSAAPPLCASCASSAPRPGCSRPCMWPPARHGVSPLGGGPAGNAWESGPAKRIPPDSLGSTALPARAPRRRCCGTPTTRAPRRSARRAWSCCWRAARRRCAGHAPRSFLSLPPLRLCLILTRAGAAAGAQPGAGLQALLSLCLLRQLPWACRPSGPSDNRGSAGSQAQLRAAALGRLTRAERDTGLLSKGGEGELLHERLLNCRAVRRAWWWRGL